jgi:beta-glucosidase/6-phospho-beta-glucosidase/beta-galactosidase
MARLGVNAYRMGIEWSRLQSAPFAPLNQKELARYVHLLDCLKAANITPMVVLHHFSNPPWITAAGGWLNPAAIPPFVDYTAKLSAALKERVYLWNTFNEPDTYASLTYLLGGFPPFEKWKFLKYRKVIKHMAEAHAQASRAIQKINFRAHRKSASRKTGRVSVRSKNLRCGIICSRKFPITPSTVLCWMNFSAGDGARIPHFSA